jgi:amino acid transporter
VGNAAVISTLYIIVPFVVMAVLAVPRIEVRNWVQQDWGSVKWGAFLNVMFWNLNYWDSVSTLAGEVAHPRRTFPRALFIAVALVVVMYVGPLLVGLGVTVQSSDWELGYFTRVAQIVGGTWLGWWMVSAAAISQIGQFEAEMCSDSFQLLGMAQRGFLPAVLARRSLHGTPTLAIILSSVGVMALVSFDFLSIVELLNIIYCLAQLVEFTAFIYLRIKLPSLPRPYQVPLPTWACALMLLPAMGLLVTIIAIPFYTLQWKTMAWTLGAMIVGSALHPLMQAARRNNWMTFVDTSPEKFYDSLLSYEAPSDDFVSSLAEPHAMEEPEEVPPEDYKEEEEGPASPWYATSTDTDLDSLLGSIPEEGESRLQSGSESGHSPRPPHPEDVEAPNGSGRLSFSAFGSAPRR